MFLVFYFAYNILRFEVVEPQSVVRRRSLVLQRLLVGDWRWLARSLVSWKFLWSKRFREQNCEWLDRIGRKWWSHKSAGDIRRTEFGGFGARTLDYTRAINIACNRAVGRESEKGVLRTWIPLVLAGRLTTAQSSAGERQFADGG